MNNIFIFIIVVLSVWLIVLSYNPITRSDLQELAEAAYFEGQRDALNSDIRITVDSMGNWKWISSPWEDKRPVIYDPQQQ